MHFPRKTARNVFLSSARQTEILRASDPPPHPPSQHLLWQAIEFACVEKEAIKDSGGNDGDPSAC